MTEVFKLVVRFKDGYEVTLPDLEEDYTDLSKGIIKVALKDHVYTIFTDDVQIVRRSVQKVINNE